MRLAQEREHNVGVAYLSAALAHVWLLARMYSRVNGQRRPLNELLIAAGMFANMRPNTAVDPFCHLVSL